MARVGGRKIKDVSAKEVPEMQTLAPMGAADKEAKTPILPKRIAVYLGPGEYPSLHIMVTDNPRYFEAPKVVSDNPKEIAERVHTWLKKQLAAPIKKPLKK